MARYPCDATGHRYGGKQSTLYISAYTPEGKSNWMLRLCPVHFADCWAAVASCTTDWAEPDLEEPIMCPVCRLLEAPGYLVATFYDGDVPAKRAGCVCSDHAPGLLKSLHIDTEVAQRS